MRYMKCSADVLVALRPGQSNLRSGFAPAFEDICRELEAGGAHLLERRIGDQFCLVESSLPALGRMQWHRNDHRRLQICWKFGKRLRKHCSQNAGRRQHPVILQEMNQITKFAVVGPISHGLRKVRCFLRAGLANRGWGIGRQILTAYPAGFALNGAYCFQTGWAHGQQRNIFQRGAAKTAIGGEQRSEQTLGDEGRARNRRMEPLVSSRNGPAICVSGTAED